MKTKLENFEMAFLSGFGSCRMACACGKEFYEPSGPWTWEKGELEALEKSSAVKLDYCPSQLDFEGRQFVDACDCWHPRAKQIMGFLDGHLSKIVEYMKLERKRKFDEASASPVVDAVDTRGGEVAG